MTRIFYYAWEKPACCVSKISSDCGCQSKETGVGMEVRLLSVGARGFFSSLCDSPSRLRRSILSLPMRKNTSGTQGTCWLAGYWSLSVFCMFMGQDLVSVHRHTKDALGQYPTILTPHLDIYILLPVEKCLLSFLVFSG